MAGRYAKEKYPKDLTGLKFGKLTIISKGESYRSPKGSTASMWWCQYINGEGECAIHSLPGLFDSLQDIAKETDISESLTRKNPLKEVKTAKVITRIVSKP